MIVDFLSYVETLINLFRLSEKLDAAGASLTSILRRSFQKAHEH